MRSRHGWLGVGLLALAVTSLTSAQEWTRFRGPNGSGIGEGTDLECLGAVAGDTDDVDRVQNCE